MLEKFQAAMEKSLIPFANKLSQNKVLKAISGGFSALLPIIMVGAIASLLSGLNIEAYQNLITAIGLKPIVAYISAYTTNMMAVYAVFSIGHSMAKQLECKDQAILVGIISLMVFLLTIPLGVSKDEVTIAAAISTTYFGAAGLFTSMIIGCIVPFIYNIFVKNHIVICSISEPLVFGVPLVLNVVMLIPMILSPLCCFLSSYLMTSIGVLPYLNGIQLSTGTPVVLAGFLAGGWRAAIWQVVLVALQFAIYFPFFRMVDKQALEEEKNA